ncbi:MAG: 50S ribosomal protein L4 [Planctomycetota bacterium]|nr:50S ribosomal protein L4 [Planctomycetota bacterium]MDI6788223.1 50S ribosomal protein L4 [Planctomycetota bacterium]
MIELTVYDSEGKEVEKVSVDEALFGGKVNKKLLQEIVVLYQSNQRQGTACAKDRGEVEGSTRKPWRQKGTGRARAGTIRSPIWRHGGVVFGPKPRSYYYNIPQQLRQKALDSALLSKFKDNETTIIDKLNTDSLGSLQADSSRMSSGQVEKPRTKWFFSIIKKLGIDPKNPRPKNKCLIGVSALGGSTRVLHLSARNIRGIKLMPVAGLNAYDIMRYQRLMLTKDALEHLISQRK